MVPLKKTFNGFFNYDEHIHQSEKTNIAFLLNIEVLYGSFEGTFIDQESKEVFKIVEPAIVKGFIEGGHINFVVHHPFYYYFDEYGDPIVDKNSKHPEVVYDCYYNKQNSIWVGEWDMILEEDIPDESHTMEAYCKGYFEMK